MKHSVKRRLATLTRPQRSARWALNFDGVGVRGILPFRAINPDGDIEIEFYMPSPLVIGTTYCIVNQSNAATQTSREFSLYIAASGNLGLVIGGSTIAVATLGQYEAGKKYRWTLIGTTSRFYDSTGALIRSLTVTRGTAREPTAQTIIGARFNSSTGAYIEHFIGPQKDIKINGTVWPIAERNQSIQMPNPTSLGAELITLPVLESPAIKGSQWTYLGNGRWQYIGDGSLNEVIFIAAGVQPASGYLEFEIESISGVITCSQNALSRSKFSDIGVKRYFFTDKNENGSNGASVSFKRADNTVASCVIKNISFKPLGTFEPNILPIVSGRSIVGGTGGSFSGDTLTTTEAAKIGRWSWPIGTFAINQLYRITFSATVAGTIDICDSPSPSITFAAGTVTVYLYRTPDKSDDLIFRFIDIGLNTAGSATLISVEKVVSLCNPIQLTNAVSNNWVNQNNQFTEISQGMRWAPMFDGVGVRGQLANRAINPDGDIDIEWFQSSNVSGHIISQCDSTAIGQREFMLRWNTGRMDFQIGGNPIVDITQNINIAIGRWAVSYSGTTVKVYFNGAQVYSNQNRTRGIGREPAAPTRIGVRNNGGSFVENFQGLLFDVKINGTRWPMADRNQAIQLPEPSGLGAELFANASLSNAASNWGKLNATVANEAAGLRITNTSAGAGFIFQTITTVAGVKYVARVSQTAISGTGLRITINNGGSAAYTGSISNRNVSTPEIGQILLIEFEAASTQTTIGFFVNGASIGNSIIVDKVEAKSLGTCNPMTISNTTWTEVPV